jgi:2,3-bisphosphoglycerate-independent phosphoglycerate mutase
MDATIKAVETVNRSVARLVEAVQEKGGVTLITADHGNAEQMIDYDTGGPFTSHTTRFPVPFIVVAGEHPSLKDCKVRNGGVLADVAPTVLSLLELDQPPQMEGKSLLDCPTNDNV